MFGKDAFDDLDASGAQLFDAAPTHARKQIANADHDSPDPLCLVGAGHRSNQLETERE
jgi:hypothetical protein